MHSCIIHVSTCIYLHIPVRPGMLIRIHTWCMRAYACACIHVHRVHALLMESPLHAKNVFHIYLHVAVWLPVSLCGCINAHIRGSDHRVHQSYYASVHELVRVCKHMCVDAHHCTMHLILNISVHAHMCMYALHQARSSVL